MTAEQAASMLRDDLNSFVRSELERAFNEALDGEIEDFLLAASSLSGEKIYRNGYYERVIKTSYGPLSLRVPRDRLALFKTEMLKPYQRTTKDLEYLVQRLYLQGLTLNEISEHLADCSSTDLSRESVRKLAAKLAKKAEEFRNRDLPECVVVFMDGTYVPLKRSYGEESSVSKECIEVAIGIAKDGRRQVLDFRSVPQEGAGNWSDFLESLKKRGIGDPKLFVTDGLSGMQSTSFAWSTSRGTYRKPSGSGIGRKSRMASRPFIRKAPGRNATRHSTPSSRNGGNRIRSSCSPWPGSGIRCSASTNSPSRCGGRFTPPTRRSP